MDKEDEIIQIYSINKTLLEIINKNLDKEKVPSRELLDTIKLSLAITTALS